MPVYADFFGAAVAVFVFGFQWGMAGAAAATIIVQIVMNKSLKYYGSISVYGEAVPIACAGIITKVNQIFMSFVIGISQGLQPITSNFFTSIDKPKTGMFLSLMRQILFLLPLLIILPLLAGIDGIMYAGPIADFCAGVTAVILLLREFGRNEYK